MMGVYLLSAHTRCSSQEKRSDFIEQTGEFCGPSFCRRRSRSGHYDRPLFRRYLWIGCRRLRWGSLHTPCLRANPYAIVPSSHPAVHPSENCGMALIASRILAARLAAGISGINRSHSPSVMSLVSFSMLLGQHSEAPSDGCFGFRRISNRRKATIFGDRHSTK